MTAVTVYMKSFDLYYYVKCQTRAKESEICMSTATHTAMLLVQRFPTWSACTPAGTFAYLKGYIEGYQ